MCQKEASLRGFCYICIIISGVFRWVLELKYLGAWMIGRLLENVERKFITGLEVGVKSLRELGFDS